MRFLIVMSFLVLVVGCQSIPDNPNRHTCIAEALKQPISKDQAVALLVADLDRSIREFEARIVASTNSNDEIRVLTAMRQKRVTELDRLLLLSNSGDELWEYQTYAASGQRGGEMGIALVRNGEVVERMVVLIVD